MNIEQQLIGRLKNAGSGIEIAGLIIVLMNLFTFFVLSKSTNLISFIFISNVLLGIIFILLGWKIHKNVNTAKWRLVVALTFATLLLILNFYNDQTSGMAIYVPAVMLASSLMGLDAVKKLRNLSLGIAEVEPQNLKGINKAKDILKMVIAAIVIIGFFLVVSYFGFQVNKKPPLSSDISINATALRIAKLDGENAGKDYVIRNRISALLVASIRWQPAQSLSFAGFCRSAEAQPFIDEITKLNVGGVSGFNCTDSDKTLAISTSVNNGKFICADNSDYRTYDTNSLHSGLSCDRK
jgi:predicted secreted protein